MLKGDNQYGLGKGNNPRSVFVGFNQSNSIMGSSNGYPAVTQAQILDQSRHHKDRIPATNKGVKKPVSFEEIHRMAQDKKFVFEYSQTGNEYNIFLGCQSSFSMMRASLTTKSSINQLIQKIENALKFPGSQRYEKLKEIISSDSYQQITKTGSKDAKAYEWMASCIDKHILGNGKIARSFITDADLALDAFLKCFIFQTDCQRLQCMVHFEENVETYCDFDKAKIRGDIFGTVVGTSRYKGLLDELSYPEFEAKLHYLSSLDYWIRNPRLIEWLKPTSRRERIFKRYGLLSRIRGGWGYKACETNTVECENKIIKEDIYDMTPVPEVIRKVEARVHSQIIIAGTSFVQDDPVQLRNQSEFVGLEGWKRLSTDSKLKKFNGIGLENSDEIAGFTMAPTTFPPTLAPNMTEQQRREMMQQSKKVEVFASASPGVFLVSSTPKAFFVYTKDEKIKCQCNFQEKHQNICLHILAVHNKYPDLKVIQKLENNVKELTSAQIHEIMTSKDSGAKTSRRRAPPETRNRKRKIVEVIDAELSTTNTPAKVLCRFGTSSQVPAVAPISAYNSFRQLENLPQPVRITQQPLHPPTVNALRNYKQAFNIKNNELWFNGHSFHLKLSSKVANAYKRKCAHCNLSIKKQSHPFVFTHLERFEYVIQTTNEVKVGFGERIICVTYACFVTRYPYSDPNCIISEIDDANTFNILQSIYAP
uniref:SWIM-type domain-containing protein n=1 Tax=Panagrolaimus davidi TaxID=227884 RepID=A0A914QGF5_9BILA